MAIDQELTYRIKMEYELEQLNKSFEEKYKEQQKHTLEVSAYSIDSGNTSVINLVITNDVTITGIKFDMILPDNVILNNLELTERSLDFEITTTELINNTYDIIMSTENLKGIGIGDDPVLTINITDMSSTQISEKTVIITNIDITVAEPVIYNKDTINIKF